MKEEKIFNKVLRIGLPISLENMIYGLINFIDVFMVGSENILLGLGVSAVAGLGFANQIFNFFIISLFGMNSGSGILAAQYFGSKDYKNLKKCLGVTLIVGFLFSLIFLFGGLLIPEKIIGIFTKDTKVLNLAVSYFRIVVWTFPLVAIGFAFNMQLRAIGQTKFSMYSSMLGLIVNVVGNYSLIYGNFGMPALGVRGAAISTILARLAGIIYVIIMIYKFKLPIAGTFKELFNIPLDFFTKTLKISLPVFGHEIMWALGASIYIVIFGRIGTDSAASIQIVKSISGLVLTLIFGLSNATSAIIGNEIGANNEEKAYEYSKILLKTALIMGIAISCVIYMISPLLLKVMKISPEIYPLTKTIIISEIILIVIKSVTLQLVVGILRAGGDTFWTMWVDLIPLWLVAIPLTYFSGIILHLPVAVVYLISGTDEILKIYPCFKRLKSKKWINNLVE